MAASEVPRAGSKRSRIASSAMSDDDSEPASLPEADDNVLRISSGPLLYTPTDVAEFCSPTCGLTLPISCFLPMSSFGAVRVSAQAFRPVCSVSISLHPRWDLVPLDAATQSSRNGAVPALIGVRAAAIISTPAPAEVHVEINRSSSLATATSSGSTQLRLESRFLHPILIQNGERSSQLTVIRFSNVLRLSSALRSVQEERPVCRDATVRSETQAPLF